MLYWIHKGTKNKKVTKLTKYELEKLLQDGWEKGKCKSHWITNGVINKLLLQGEQLPNGFKFGQSQQFKNKNKESQLKRWKNMSKQKKEQLSNKISNSVKNMWENLTDQQIQLRQNNRMHTRENWSKQYKIKYHNILSESAKKNRKTISKQQYHRRSVKGSSTKRKNNSYNTSKFQKNCYSILCDVFGNQDIFRQYIDQERYPFKCDFYVKSKDLFIQLNLHPSHSEHRFDPNNSQDNRLLENLKIKNDDWSNMIIDVWAIRDVEKVKVAEKII